MCCWCCVDDIFYDTVCYVQDWKEADWVTKDAVCCWCCVDDLFHDTVCYVQDWRKLIGSQQMLYVVGVM